MFSTPTHNGVEHIQDRYIFELVECIKELKEHNHKTNILLEKALKLVIANENGFHEQLEQERQAHQLSKLHSVVVLLVSYIFVQFKPLV